MKIIMIVKIYQLNIIKFGYNRGDNKMMNDYVLPLTVLIIVALVYVISNQSKAGIELDIEQQAYCEMVEMFDNDNSTGHPDYKNIYNTSCQ